MAEMAAFHCLDQHCQQHSAIFLEYMRCLEFAQGKTLSRGFFNEYSFKQLHRETRGQWQKCYGKASMSILFFWSTLAHGNDISLSHHQVGKDLSGKQRDSQTSDVVEKFDIESGD